MFIKKNFSLPFVVLRRQKTFKISATAEDSGCKITVFSVPRGIKEITIAQLASALLGVPANSIAMIEILIKKLGYMMTPEQIKEIEERIKKMYRNRGVISAFVPNKNGGVSVMNLFPFKNWRAEYTRINDDYKYHNDRCLLIRNFE